uniref:Uncharacterized protein n=1 Tax=Anguilla anguilla TaxID=7936 RepID=A0A0E9UDU0_ANGAN
MMLLNLSFLILPNVHEALLYLILNTDPLLCSLVWKNLSWLSSSWALSFSHFSKRLLSSCS